MVLIIDGHNLIPLMPGLNLSDPEDETQLIQMLQGYCRLSRKQVEVFFDQAPAGQAGEQHFGSVLAYFVRQGSTADEAIMLRLRQLGKSARNVAVVSNDRQVQQAARAAHATVIPASAFVEEWEALMAEEPELNPRNRLLSESELEAWEQLFQRGHPPRGKEE